MKNSIIFTTGAFLEPKEITTKDNKKYWLWVVTEFVDDSYSDGKIFNPKEWSYSEKKLTNVECDS